MEELFEKLKISPKNLTLYNIAVSHSSYANEHRAKKDYERLPVTEECRDAAIEFRDATQAAAKE